MKHNFFGCLGAAVALFFLWWLISSFLNLPIVPAPWKVLERLQQIFLSSIAVHALYSLGRITLGLLLAVGIGYPVGIFMGHLVRVDRIFSPFVYLLGGDVKGFDDLPHHCFPGRHRRARCCAFDSSGDIRSASFLGGITFFCFQACSLSSIFTQIYYCGARCHGNGDFCIIFYGDIWCTIWFGILHHGRMASCQLFRDVCRDHCSQPPRIVAFFFSRFYRDEDLSLAA